MLAIIFLERKRPKKETLSEWHLSCRWKVATQLEVAQIFAKLYRRINTRPLTSLFVLLLQRSSRPRSAPLSRCYYLYCNVLPLASIHPVNVKC